MSQPKRNRPPIRRMPPEANLPNEEEDQEYQDHQEDYEEDYEEEYPPDEEEEEEPEQSYVSQRRPRARPEYSPRSARAGQGYGGYGQGYRGRNVAPKRDAFPIVMGAIVGAAVVGLLAIGFLIATRSSAGSSTSAQPSNPSSNTIPTLASSDTSGTTDQSSQASSGGEPPRMPLEDFKKLYDDPAKRPLIIDVRNKDIFDQGHIKGAVSFPESDVDSRVGELPKDKLIVAYCQ